VLYEPARSGSTSRCLAIKRRISRRRILNRSIFNQPELSQLLSRKWEEKAWRSVSFGHSVRSFVMARRAVHTSGVCDNGNLDAVK